MMALARWLLFTTLVWSVGTVTVRWLVVGSSADRRLAGMGIVSSGVAVLALLTLGVGQLLAFRDPFSPWGREAAVLLGTTWGRASSAGLVTAVGLGAAFFIARRGARGHSPAWIAAAGLTFVLAFYPAFTGHALGSERFTFFAVLLDGVHVLSAGAWIGSLGVLLVVYFHPATPVSGAMKGDPDDAPLPPISVTLPRFSRIAVVSVVTVVVSGVFAGWLHLPSLPSLFTSGYGRLLAAKVLLVVLVAGLGRMNWRRWKGREGGGIERPGRAALLEVAIAHAVLLVTALLVATAPPMAG